MGALGRAAGVGDRHARARAASRRSRAATAAPAKPSGAGGGDLGVAFTVGDEADRARPRRRCRAAGLTVLPLSAPGAGLAIGERMTAFRPACPGSTSCRSTSGARARRAAGAGRRRCAPAGRADCSTRRPPTTWSRTSSASTRCRSASALNFRVNGARLPGADGVEEPSVVAAASNAARMVREGGGFVAEADEPIMIAQVQLVDVRRPGRRHAAHRGARATRSSPGATPPARRWWRAAAARAASRCACSSVDRARAGMLVVHLHVDCRDAMGANMVNTVAEAVADRAWPSSPAAASGCASSVNLADRRCVRVTAARAGALRSPPTRARRRERARRHRRRLALRRARSLPRRHPQQGHHERRRRRGDRHRQRLARRRGGRARLRRHAGERQLRPAGHLARGRRRRRPGRAHRDADGGRHRRRHAARAPGRAPGAASSSASSAPASSG